VQFFELAGSSKTRKADIEWESGDAPEFAEQDEDEDAMPGFHEHDENDVGIDQASAEIDGDSDHDAATFLVPMSGEGLISPPRRPPHSAPVRAPLGASSSALTGPHTSTKPRSTNQTRTLPFPPDGTESNTCPICDKVMKLDNQAFNAHVDFCLSRETIREAQSQATTRVKRKSDTATHDSTGRTLNRSPLQKRKKY
jgi:DNA polymerase kappa